jgi:SNF2 family DNA or RNA helicase
VLVLNHELLRRDIDDLLNIKWQALVVDEAHRLKGRNTGVALAAGKIAWRAQGVALLTGTPVLNDAYEVWPLLHIVRPKQYRSFWKWVNEHFHVELTTFHGKLPRAIRVITNMKPGHDELIKAELAEVMIARPNLLPHVPVRAHIVPVELNENERRAYENIDAHGWAHIGGELVEASTPLTKMTRLRQLASEWSTFSEDVEAGTKVTAALELLNEQPDRVVILTAYKATARALYAQLYPGNTGMFTGDESKKQRAQALREFGEGRTNCIIGTIAAMGEGVDGLQVASKMIRLERDWTPARNTQAIGRILRDGQLAEAVDVWDIVAADTVDQEVAEMLARKADIVDRVVPAR